MRLVRTIEEVRAEVRRARERGLTIGLVPTMGFLHEGHLSLVDRCHQLVSFVVMSIYVNPLQFAPAEDFDDYPRDLGRDLKLAEARGVDLVFAPDDRELYPKEPAVGVVPKLMADRLCALSRPGHFEGVLTVVSKLFGIIQPDIAVFGQKDFQQSVLIERMVADLNLPVRIETAPTIRESDGVAMSSRNAYLSPAERVRARALSRALAESVRLFRAGERAAATLRDRALNALEDGGVDAVEYVEIVTADGLEPVRRVGEDAVMAMAARVGDTRLIDNARLAAPDTGLERLL